MFRANYKATMKNLLRSPATVMAFGATIILIVSLYKGGTDGEFLGKSAFRQDMLNQILSTCKNLFPPFVGMLISAHILEEIKNGFGDLLITSRKSILSIYLSKLCAVATVTLAARLMYLAVKLIWFWCFRYPEAYEIVGVSLPLGDILSWYAIQEIICMPFMLLCYTAMPVFITVATNITSAGAVWNVGFYLAHFMSSAFNMSNFSLMPESSTHYLFTFCKMDNPQEMADLQAGLIENAQGKVPPNFMEALIPYIGWIVASVVLLTAAYLILKKRYRE